MTEARDDSYREIFDDVPVGLYQTTVEGRILHVNQACADILGYASTDEMIGRSALEFWVSADDRAGLQARLARDGVVRDVEVAFQRADGSTIWARNSVRALRDAAGRVLRYEGAIQDVTEEHRLAAALRESERQYRTLFEQSPEPLFVHDAETLGFLAVNLMTEALYGWSREEFARMTLWDIRPPDERGRLEAFISRTPFLSLAEDPRGYGEWVHRRKDGSPIVVEIASAAIAFEGRRARLVLVKDVTARKETERRNQRLLSDLRNLSRELVDSQERERRHIAAELHDEIGQLLTGLKFLLEVGRVGGLDASRVERAAAAIDELMGRVRDMSLDLRPRTLDHLGLLAALLGHFQRFTARTGVAVGLVHSGIDRRLPPAVETAAFRIVQEALTNVARHAGVTHAAVTVSTGSDSLFLRVEDRGAGFEVERALDGAAGAGLSGMRERANALGGTLSIDSAAGIGTRVVADLPLDPPDAAERGA